VDVGERFANVLRQTCLETSQPNELAEIDVTRSLFVTALIVVAGIGFAPVGRAEPKLEPDVRDLFKGKDRAGQGDKSEEKFGGQRLLVGWRNGLGGTVTSISRPRKTHP
jgi:hypothetical protein